VEGRKEDDSKNTVPLPLALHRQDSEWMLLNEANSPGEINGYVVLNI
jgi:hypothetical protein